MGGLSRTFIPISVFVCLNLLAGRVEAATFTFTNNCDYTVWPGILSSAATNDLPTTGFDLQPGESRPVTMPSTWSGRMWGRTLCTANSTIGKFTCLTGDCGSSTIQCNGLGALPPTTLAEFTLDGSNGMDFYDVSLVDGYNLPILVVPRDGSSGNCTSTGCLVDLNESCPNELKVVGSGGDGVVACRSACEAFGSPEYCCSGDYGNPNTCKPSSYSKFFKSACPRSYSYAYDDATSTFTCVSAKYDITFCPSTSKDKSRGQHDWGATLPNTAYLGGEGPTGGSSSFVPSTLTVSMWLIGFFSWLFYI